jgi:hypothetical protein
MSSDFVSVPESAPTIGAIHTHYKNPSKEYRVTGLSLNSDTDEWHVEYIPLYEGSVAPKFNRVLSSWNEKVITSDGEYIRYPFVRLP